MHYFHDIVYYISDISLFLFFKVYIMLRVYNQHIQILSSTQQLFINIYSTACFDTEGPSSGAVNVTDTADTKLIVAHDVLKIIFKNHLKINFRFSFNVTVKLVLT
jgi:hypothetical protein